MAISQYIVVSPTRDEEAYLGRTIDSMVAQTLKPKVWVIVNDGSSDRTGQIAEEASVVHKWIRVVQRVDRGFRQAGTGVMDAFFEGLAAANTDNSDFLVKLDADLSFSEDYFERCLSRFREIPRLGIGGGTLCHEVRGSLQPESGIDPVFHVRGATKIYRRECWDEIGGLIRKPGWDTVDELKANMLGWKTMTFPDIVAVHHRLTGQAYGIWNDQMKMGRANYAVGYHPLFMLLKCVKRLFYPPYIIGAAALFRGYFESYFRGLPRVPDEPLLRYFERQQFRKLLFRKSLWG